MSEPKIGDRVLIKSGATTLLGKIVGETKQCWKVKWRDLVSLYYKASAGYRGYQRRGSSDSYHRDEIDVEDVANKWAVIEAELQRRRDQAFIIKNAADYRVNPAELRGIVNIIEEALKR